MGSLFSERGLSPWKLGSREGWIVSHNRLGLGDWKLTLPPIVSQPLVNMAQTSVLMPIQWETKSYRNQIPNLPCTRQLVHLPSNPQFSIFHVWPAAGKVILYRALMWMWLERFWFLSPILSQLERSTKEVVRESWWKSDNWNTVGKMAWVGMYLSNRRAISVTATVFWMGDYKIEVNTLVKTWMALLAEIIFQGSTEEILWQY